VARAKTNGIEIEYETIGDGEPLLLIMGLGRQLVMWPDDFCHQLARRGFRVIRFDNRDVGLSTNLRDQGTPRVKRGLARALLGLPVDAPYTLLDMADDVGSTGVVDRITYEGSSSEPRRPGRVRWGGCQRGCVARDDRSAASS
jgi:pimeloyl-ACP methyl ester carboxylesterase